MVSGSEAGDRQGEAEPVEALLESLKSEVSQSIFPVS